MKTLDLALFFLASPVLLVRALVRGTRRVRFWHTSSITSRVCRSCGAGVSLVGLWRCQCGFTYEGHVLQLCPVCGSTPRMLCCFECGVTESLPRP